MAKVTKFFRNMKLNKKFTSDFPLVVVVVLLVIFGTVMIFSASYYFSISREGTPYAYLKKQVVYAAIGFVLMYLFSLIDYHIYKKYAIWILAANIVLLLALFTPLGMTVNGATRWINLKVMTIMPGELAKIGIIIFAAAYFSNNMSRAKKLSTQLPLIVITLVICGLIYKQPNLSTAMTVVAIAIGISFLAGLNYRYLIGLLVIAVGGMAGIAMFGSGYQRDRILSFMDPMKDALGDGFQVVQSLLALGNGGLTGVGIGKSVQKTLYLPEPQTDFILAIVGEELGFIGIAVLMLLFILLVWRTFIVSVKAPDKFGMLVCGGVGLMVAIQVIFNVAVVTSSMPPTGVALPFISYGGNSLWIFLTLFGVVLNVSRQERKLELR